MKREILWSHLGGKLYSEESGHHGKTVFYQSLLRIILLRKIKNAYIPLKKGQKYVYTPLF